MAHANDDLGNSAEYEQRTCCDCGDTWMLSRGEREFFAGRGLSEPRRCKPCRAAKRAERLQQQDRF
jgi:putative zinc ribbon protein